MLHLFLFVFYYNITRLGILQVTVTYLTGNLYLTGNCKILCKIACTRVSDHKKNVALLSITFTLLTASQSFIGRNPYGLKALAPCILKTTRCVVVRELVQATRVGYLSGMDQLSYLVFGSLFIIIICGFFFV